jgi:hypothetical protein
MFNCRASCRPRVSRIEQTGSLFADISRNIANTEFLPLSDNPGDHPGIQRIAIFAVPVSPNTVAGAQVIQLRRVTASCGVPEITRLKICDVKFPSL